MQQESQPRRKLAVGAARAEKEKTAHQAQAQVQAAVRKEQLRGAVDSFKQSSIQVFQVSRSEVELLVELVKLVVQLGELHVKLQKDLILFKKGFSTSISSRFNRSSAQLQPRVQTVGRGTRGHSS